jgi:hypothetical protein
MQPKMKLLQSLRAKLRLAHFSPRTEEAYVYWRRPRTPVRLPIVLSEADVRLVLACLNGVPVNRSQLLERNTDNRSSVRRSRTSLHSSVLRSPRELRGTRKRGTWKPAPARRSRQIRRRSDTALVAAPRAVGLSCAQITLMMSII